MHQLVLYSEVPLYAQHSAFLPHGSKLYVIDVMYCLSCYVIMSVALCIIRSTSCILCAYLKDWIVGQRPSVSKLCLTVNYITSGDEESALVYMHGGRIYWCTCTEVH